MSSNEVDKQVASDASDSAALPPEVAAEIAQLNSSLTPGIINGTEIPTFSLGPDSAIQRYVQEHGADRLGIPSHIGTEAVASVDEINNRT